ncbi:methyltransferase domain-containing protein [Hufsiella ginkgonis]|uniref:Methyltransferase domain-containing protein n=1 Tax=Hufsiella ginkgonis TaxID=2695274 RepID=A0A7K1XTN9_9SPHI|nr:methyltransferase domain-containing protein [Hufsiella ginkgonis]MXV14383.1 methyltransferase domain-containing protein [Hufsiella ginkgonis]
MSAKHYNISYLEQTGRFLKNLKEQSYQPFTAIRKGAVIDLGCGTGMDVLKLSELLGGQVKVFGIDHDPEMLAKGKAAAYDNKQVEFILSEASPIPFTDGTVQGVRAERLVQHLTAPDAVMKEIHRVLEHDHPLVLVETDWPGLSFCNAHLPIERKVIGYLTDVKINNGLAARKLTGYLEAAGFRDIRLELFPFVIRTLAEANEYLWIERILKETADNGFISQEEHDIFLGAMKDADASGYFACSIQVVVTTCVK